jgi:hypothetical protein
LFAVLVHFIDSKWEYHARLAICKGLADSSHTGEVISDITNKGLIDIGLGDDDTLVQDCIHSCTPDEGSNMLKGWKEFEGAGCVCHRQQNCLGKCLEVESIKPIISKIKGICAHFHRSHKVLHDVFHHSSDILSLTLF